MKRVPDEPISNDIVAEYKDTAFHRDGCCQSGKTIRTTARQMSWSKAFRDHLTRHRCPDCGNRLNWERGLPVASIYETRIVLAVCRLIAREYATEPYAFTVCGSFAKAEIFGATEAEILIRVSYGVSDGYESHVTSRIEKLPRNLITTVKTAEEVLPFVVPDSAWEHEDHTLEDQDEQLEINSDQ